jgi:hypothetical protein
MTGQTDRLSGGPYGPDRSLRLRTRRRYLLARALRRRRQLTPVPGPHRQPARAADPAVLHHPQRTHPAALFPDLLPPPWGRPFPHRRQRLGRRHPRISCRPARRLHLVRHRRLQTVALRHGLDDASPAPPRPRPLVPDRRCGRIPRLPLLRDPPPARPDRLARQRRNARIRRDDAGHVSQGRDARTALPRGAEPVRHRPLFRQRQLF